MDDEIKLMLKGAFLGCYASTIAFAIYFSMFVGDMVSPIDYIYSIYIVPMMLSSVYAYFFILPRYLS